MENESLHQEIVELKQNYTESKALFEKSVQNRESKMDSQMEMKDLEASQDDQMKSQIQKLTNEKEEILRKALNLASAIKQLREDVSK